MTKDANNKIAKNTIALYCRTALTMLISFFTVRYTLQALGVEDYGLYNLVGSIAAMFTFLNLSMGTAVQRFFSYSIGKGDQEQLKKVFGVGIYLHIIVAIATIIIGELFALFYFKELNIPGERLNVAMIIFQISLVSMSCNIIAVPYSALLRAREEFSKYAILDIAQASLRLVFLLILLNINYDRLLLFSLGNLTLSLSYIAGTIYFSKKYKEAKWHICRDKNLIKEMFSFISMLLITVLLSLVRDNGLIMLINLFFGLTINAAYAVAMQIMHMVSHFAANFKQSIVPQIMSSYSSENFQRMKTLTFSGTKITFMLMMCITMPIMIEPHFVLNIILDEVPQYSAEFTRLVLININVSSFTYLIYQGVHATGNIKNQQIGMSVIYLINILGVYIVFKLGFGFYSSIYVTIVCSFIQCITNVYFAKKKYNFEVSKFIKEVVLPSALLCVFIAIPSSLISISLNYGWCRMIFVGVSIIITLFIGGYYIYMNKQERAMCKKIISKFAKPKNIFKKLANKDIEE